MSTALKMEIDPQNIIAAVKKMKKQEREEFIEDLLAATSPEYLTSIHEARTEYKAGKGVDHEQMQAESLFKDALRLSPVDRVKLMDLLFDSFHHNRTRTAHEVAWAEHAEDVCAQIDSKMIPLHSLESVLSELNQ